MPDLHFWTRTIVYWIHCACWVSLFFGNTGRLTVGTSIVPLIDSCRKNSSSGQEKCSQKPREFCIFSVLTNLISSVKISRLETLHLPGGNLHHYNCSTSAHKLHVESRCKCHRCLVSSINAPIEELRRYSLLG